MSRLALDIVALALITLLIGITIGALLTLPARLTHTCTLIDHTDRQIDEMLRPVGRN